MRPIPRTDPGPPYTDLVLTGPEALGQDDIATTITQVTCRSVNRHRLAYEQMRDRLMGRPARGFRVHLEREMK